MQGTIIQLHTDIIVVIIIIILRQGLLINDFECLIDVLRVITYNFCIEAIL